jgi:hypothetical protein
MNEQVQVSGGDELRPGRRRPLVIILLSLLAMAAWIWLLNFLLAHYAATNYLKWYLKNGSLISLGTAFFGMMWKKLGEEEGLLSLHPLRFLACCFSTAGVFFEALAVNLGGPLDGVNPRAGGPLSIAAVLWDSAFGMLMDVLMMIVVLGWLLVVAPGFYLLNLFTGAPARREIRGTGRKLVVQREGNLTTITEQLSSSPVPSGAIDVSFGAQPFVLTNALNAVVIFLANMLMSALR